MNKRLLLCQNKSAIPTELLPPQFHQIPRVKTLRYYIGRSYGAANDEFKKMNSLKKTSLRTGGAYIPAVFGRIRRALRK
jgi:hypothetical protein